MVLLLCISCIVLGGKAEAKAAYKSAYLKAARQFNKAYPQTLAKNRYALIYIDNDKVPELVCDHSGYFLSIYTYKKGKTYCLTSTSMSKTWSYGAGGNYGYRYIPKKNKVLNIKADGGGKSYTYSYFKISNGALKISKQIVIDMIEQSTEPPSISKKYKWITGTKTLSQLKKLLK